MTERQRVGVHVHIRPEHFRPDVWPAHADNEIATVDILDGLRIQADSPEVFYSLSSSLIAAARSIEDARQANAQTLDVAAARAVNANRLTEPFGTLPARVTSSTAPEPFDTTDAA